MWILKKANLATKLFFSYLLLVIFPFFISTLVLSSTSSDNIETNTLSYIDLFVEQLSANMDNYIDSMDRMTKVVALDSELCEILTRPVNDDKATIYHQTQYLETQILQMMTQYPGIRNITFVGTNGMIYSGPSNQIADEDYFFEITQADFPNRVGSDFYLSAAHVPSYLLVNFQHYKEAVFTLTRFLYNNERNRIGCIVLTITCQDLLNAININPSLLESGARIVVTNKENRIVADTSDRFTTENLADDAYLQFALTDEEAREDLLFSDDSGALNSTVIISKARLFKSTMDFNHTAIGLIALLMGIIILLSLYFSHKLLQPLKHLRNATNELAAGNYSIRIPVTSKDEIGDLCTRFNFMTEQTQNLMNRVYHYQLATKQAKLEALQNQINPHFLHNTLEIIRMKALINRDKEVAVMVQTLARLFRITLDLSSNIVHVKDELEHVETYLAIQNMRFDNRYRFTNLVPEEFLDCSILKLTLQPLVENAIKHGFSRTFGDEEIQVRAQADKDDLVIQVADNGVGITPDNLERIHRKLEHADEAGRGNGHNSIGIVNISDRIRLEYGDGYGLKIYPNQPRGTVVELRIPRNGNMIENNDMAERK